MVKGKDEIVQTIDSLLALLNVQWVATSDRLPEEDDEVIVWLPDVEDYDIDSISSTSREVFMKLYSHWCEKPEPPKD